MQDGAKILLLSNFLEDYLPVCVGGTYQKVPPSSDIRGNNGTSPWLSFPSPSFYSGEVHLLRSLLRTAVLVLFGSGYHFIFLPKKACFSRRVSQDCIIGLPLS